MGEIASQISGLTIVYSTVQAQIKENIKALRHWPLCGEFASEQWIPRTNGKLRGKCFHFITSSWYTSVPYRNVQCPVACHAVLLQKMQRGTIQQSMWVFSATRNRYVRLLTTITQRDIRTTGNDGSCVYTTQISRKSPQNIAQNIQWAIDKQHFANVEFIFMSESWYIITIKHRTLNSRGIHDDVTIPKLFPQCRASVVRSSIFSLSLTKKYHQSYYWSR